MVGKVIRDQRNPRQTTPRAGQAGSPLKCARLTEDSSVLFLGLSIQRIPGLRLFVSQPGYSAALVETYPYSRKQNLLSTTAGFQQQDVIRGRHGSLRRRQDHPVQKTDNVHCLASTTVAHKQTNCSAPRDIDNRDLAYIIGFIANNLIAGVVIDCRDLQLHLYVNVGHTIYEEMKSHTGELVSMGKLGEHGVPLAWKSLKQKVTTVSSTSAKLIGVSDMFDLLQCAHELAEFVQARQKTPFTMYQDNTSTIIIAYIGRSSSHEKQRFIDSRYF